MQQIEQLKLMRDEALQRLRSNPDYKLANSLDALIQDLEAFVAPKIEQLAMEMPDETTITSNTSDKTDIGETPSETIAAMDEIASIEDSVEQDAEPLSQDIATTDQNSKHEAAETAIDGKDSDDKDTGDEDSEMGQVNIEDDAEFADAIAQSIQNDNGDAASNFDDPIKANSEANAAIEALEAELSQSSDDIDLPYGVAKPKTQDRG